MELHTNFAERVAVHAARLPWQASPMAGVDRRMLDRIGAEVARATTIVRYAPGSHFSSHVHTGGEEFFVLEGVFQDEHGDFPAGSYIRNPPTSAHTPGSDEGCTIFVKLWQFDLADRNQVRIDTNSRPYADAPARPGVSVMPLHDDANESVSLEHWEPGAEVELNAPKGMEILVLEGGFEEGGDQFEPQSWLRCPKSYSGQATAGPSGARLWVKRHHLAVAPSAPST